MIVKILNDEYDGNMSHPTLDFKKAYLAMRRAVEHAIKPFDLSGGQFDVLQFLLHNDGIEHRELQRSLSISSPTLTNILDGLEKKGHIIRKPHPEDGRVKLLYLGQSARKICTSSKFYEAGDTLVEKMFDGFTKKEIMHFKNALKKIENNLEKFYP